MGTPQSVKKDIYITRNIPFNPTKAWDFYNIIDGEDVLIDISLYDDAVLIARKDYSEAVAFEWSVTNRKLSFSTTNLVFNVSSADTLALIEGTYTYNLKFISTTETEFEGSHGIACIANNTITA